MDEFDIIDDTDVIPLENTVPKILVSNDAPLYVNINDKACLMFVDKNNPELMNLLNEKNISVLNEKYKLYIINESYLHSFIVNILNTDGKFVYPLVFVNFVKNSLQTNKKISFDRNELLKLRVWANQLRNEHGFVKKRQSRFTYRELFIAYTICCEMLHYCMYSNKT